MSRTITLLTDYGLVDDFVGVCHAVMARLAPGSRIIDLSHGVPRHDVRSAALVLRRSLPYCEPGVHVAIVDPGVGGSRRAIALQTVEEDRLLVGPDNGLLTLAAQRFGGIAQVTDISRSPLRLEPVAATFHGRDIFAPVAAGLARGEHLGDVGEPVDADELVRIDMPMAVPDGGGELTAHAVGFDRFGNVMLDIEHEELTEAGFRLGYGVTINGVAGMYATTFSDVPVGELLLYQDAYRTLSVAVNRASAKDRLALRLDDTLTIRAT